MADSFPFVETFELVEERCYLIRASLEGPLLYLFECDRDVFVDATLEKDRDVGCES